MKALSFLAILLFSATVFASGKISLQGNWYDSGKNVKPMVGFGVYEKLVKNAYLNAWTGYGVQPLEIKDDVNWYVAKAQVDMRFNKLTVAPGVQYKNLPNTPGTSQTYPYFRLDWQLW